MGSVIYTNRKEIVEAVIAEGGKVVVNFSAKNWCRPCQQFAPHYQRAAAEASDIDFLDVDVDEATWAVTDYDVRAVPTVKLYENFTFVRDIKAPQGAIPFLRDIRS